MTLRTKILLLAIAPLVLVLGLIALAVRHQARELQLREHETVQRTYLEARRAELQHYVQLAVGAVQPLYANASRQDQAQRRRSSEQALAMLAALDYGTDGYFFVYDLEGRVLMHSRQPELVGQQLFELRDPQGRPTIQRLLEAAKGGGGFVEYLWRKPSSAQMTAKLGYVLALKDWNWMLGSGLYLDGIQATLDQLDREARQNIDRTMWWMAGIALGGVMLISSCALLLNLSEHRLAEQKLRLLTHQLVRSQEEERAHLARELHDGLSQTLVSTKLLVESGARTGRPEPLRQAVERLSASLHEVRRISHQLRPALLDTLGLSAALRHLGEEQAEAAGLRLDWDEQGDWQQLPEVAVTVLFRVAQEALTNALKHAGARSLALRLLTDADGGVLLQIEDDGRGFDAAAVQASVQQGMGLRNMRERLASVGGELELHSRADEGCLVEARIGAAALDRLRENRDHEATAARPHPAG